MLLFNIETMGNFYITTTIPYVNAKPHIGTALETVQADVLARYHRLLGDDVFFNFGADEHGIKILQAAEKEGLEPQEYTDKLAKEFDTLKKSLNLSYDTFIRTTNPDHKKAAQEFWKLCDASGDIYKKTYRGHYCVGCELFKTEKELENSECPLHPGKKLEVIEEENYFFRFSKYGDRLLELLDSGNYVVPDYRANEIRQLIKDGLEDFSISRLREKMPWGVSVPGDEEHVMYVWFDALVNYISTLGWPNDTEKFEKYWPVVQVAGKDQVRQQAAMWQTMLFSAGLPNSKQIMIHGFINVGGSKISKSVGNVIHPSEVADEYGVDALRYYYLRHVHPFEDSDWTDERFKEAYNANLANGLGNLVARVLKLSETHLDGSVELPEVDTSALSEHLDAYEFNNALDYIWKRIGEADQKITDTEPFKLIKTDEEKAKEIITELVQEVYAIAKLLEPFLPETAEKIQIAVKENKKPETLFARKN